MGEVYFYHLTRAPLEVTLQVLLEKARGAGWAVAVRARSDTLLERLDEQLWLTPEDGFLPHGRAGGDHDAQQPILLTTGTFANDAACLVSVEGAHVTPEEIGAMARTMVLFDGHDAEALGTARQQWKSLTGAGVAAKYWSEESGRWEMKAESAAT